MAPVNAHPSNLVRAFFLLVTSLAGISAGWAYAQVPVPLINAPLMPDAIVPGGANFTLTVNGTGFISGSVVNWNGTARPTTYISSSQLKAAIMAADIKSAGTASVTVLNPVPAASSNVAFFTITLNPRNSVGFGLDNPVGAGCSPNAVVLNDFNHDGKLDLATADLCSGTVSILLGDGMGRFTLTSSPNTGASPLFLTSGDFNDDGNIDLAVVNYYDSTVSILLGDGTGNFATGPTPMTGGSNPLAVATGDFNGDGKLDLAVTNLSNQISILLGDGTGNFALGFLATGVNLAFSLAVGDFNGDNKLDVAATNYNSDSVSIFLGDGTGNLTFVAAPGTGSIPVSVATGDFNRDGKLDLAIANNNYVNGGSTASILLGDGTGNFTLASSPAVGINPDSVAVGDFNGDSRLDLAVAAGDDTVSILLGNGLGSFILAASPAINAAEGSLAVGDFNADGQLDLAIADYQHNSVSIVLNNTSLCTPPLHGKERSLCRGK
jgi:hypothetical protein